MIELAAAGEVFQSPYLLCSTICSLRRKVVTALDKLFHFSKDVNSVWFVQMTLKGSLLPETANTKMPKRNSSVKA